MKLVPDFLVPRIFGKLRRILIVSLCYVQFPISFVTIVIYSYVSRNTFYFYRMDTKHLGGWALILDAFLRRRNAGVITKAEHVFLVNRHHVSNTFFLTLMKRQVRTVTSIWLYWFLLPLATVRNGLRGGEISYLTKYECFPPIRWFTEDEEQQGQNLLRQMGIDKTHWYACFFARDNEYSARTASWDQRSLYMDSHSCRNANIHDYEPAMEYVVKEGGVAIRIGKFVSEQIRVSDMKVIDYPFHELQSDFMDIYLPCHARFIIGACSGVVDLSTICGVPLVVTNHYLYTAPYNDFSSYEGRGPFLYIPKILRYVADGRVVTLAEFDAKLFRIANSSLPKVKKAFHVIGLQYEDNSAEDILRVTKKMLKLALEKRSRLDSQDQFWMSSDERIALSEKYGAMDADFVCCHQLA